MHYRRSSTLSIRAVAASVAICGPLLVRGPTMKEAFTEIP